jgi:hypothetical protein
MLQEQQAVEDQHCIQEQEQGHQGQQHQMQEGHWEHQ